MMTTTTTTDTDFYVHPWTIIKLIMAESTCIPCICNNDYMAVADNIALADVITANLYYLRKSL